MNYLQLHLIELKYHFIIFIFSFVFLFFVCYFFSDQLIYICIQILVETKLLEYFIFTNITEFFLTRILLSLFLSLFFSVQIFSIQIWFFFSTGFLKYENFLFLKNFIFFIFLNNFLLIFVITKLIPNLWVFFMKSPFSNEFLFNIYFEPTLINYFSFLFSSFSLFYLFFIYLFFFFFILLKFFFKIKTIIFLRKFFYFKFLILATIISPPDIFYQIIITFIFIFLFEIYIFIYLFLYSFLYNKK